MDFRILGQLEIFKEGRRLALGRNKRRVLLGQCCCFTPTRRAALTG
jgi:DNA-binding SARP family transcriptional activator